DVEDLHDPVLGHHQTELPVIRLHPLQPAYQDAQPRGVQEVHGGHVHHDLSGAPLHQVDEGLTEPGGRVDVDLPPQRHHASVTALVCFQLEVHGPKVTPNARVHADEVFAAAK